jgi:biopolymer transport protein ExbD
MAFQRAFGNDEQAMAEINVTPLVDVMLVLLVIFMVTAPLFTHAVRIDLPRARSTPSVDQPQNVTLSIDATGAVRWNGEIVAAEGVLAQRLAQAAALDPQPEVQLRADRDTRYEAVARLLSQVQRAGLTRLSFVTDPAERR